MCVQNGDTQRPPWSESFWTGKGGAPAQGTYSASVGNLIKDTVYEIRVRCRSKHGWSRWSRIFNGYTPKSLSKDNDCVSWNIPMT